MWCWLYLFCNKPTWRVWLYLFCNKPTWRVLLQNRYNQTRHVGLLQNRYNQTRHVGLLQNRYNKFLDLRMFETWTVTILNIPSNSPTLISMDHNYPSMMQPNNSASISV
jgi:hypothetical protein